MRKNEKLLSIGEIAKSIGITRRIILNYEDKGLVKPDVKEGDTGNRYYTLDTFTRVRTIRNLQDMGLTLDEIRSYYNDSIDLVPMLTRLEKLRDELSLNIERIRERIKSSDNPKVNIVTLPNQTVYKKTHSDVTVEDKKNHLREISLVAMRKYGSDVTKRLYFTEFDMKTPELVSYCAAIPPESTGEFVVKLPETQAICIYYHGAYENLPSVREALIGYAKKNDVRLSGVCRHIYLEGPPHHTDPIKFITQVALMIDNTGGDINKF